MYTTNEKFKLQSLTLCKRMQGETYMASSSAKPNHSIPISSIPPRMDTYMRTAYNITGDNEKYVLLMNVIPSSIHWGEPQNLIHYDFTGNESQENFATTKENNNPFSPAKPPISTHF